MKIGTSLGKCVKDLLDGKVKYNDVLCIVTNTMAPSEETIRAVITSYYYGYQSEKDYDLTAHTEQEAQDMAARLYLDGKLHQPRCMQKSSRSHSLDDTWYDIMPSLNSSPAVQDAWDAYVVLASLSK